MRRRLLVLVIIAAMSSGPIRAWGIRGHQAVNRAAVRGLSADGPAFLQADEDWIAYLANIPDSWRSASEPSLKILEDPNHGWFKEQFAFLKRIPRSRYEFVLALHEEHKRLLTSDPERAKLTNVRWTGTLPYAAQEAYEQMKAAMRRYRSARAANQETKFVELEIASYMGRHGHYTADGAQPLHDTIHHDGWQGENPEEYTRDPRIHGRFESAFVDLINLKVEDIQPGVGKPQHLSDTFVAILSHLDKASKHVEEVYRMDKVGSFVDGNNKAGRKLVYERLASGAALLRDLAHTAWIESANPVSRGLNPIDPKAPGYNAATGSAPPADPVQQ